MPVVLQNFRVLTYGINCVFCLTATTKAKITGSNSVTYAAASCDENFLIEFRKSFIRLIEGVQKYWPICGASCDFTNIGIKCSTPNRARRNVGGLSASITVSIPIQNAGNASYADQVQTGLKTNAFNLTVSVNGSALDSASNGITTTVKTECDKGSILKGQTCSKYTTISILNLYFMCTG